MFTHLLVPIDGSDLAEQALPAAVELASKFNSKITLIRVYQPDAHYVGGIGRAYDVSVMQDLYEKQAAEARTYLDQQVNALQAKSLNVEGYFVENASAAEALIDAVDELGIDTIVMSTHGRGGLGRWMYGSVAEKVLRHAGAPVLLIRSGDDT